VHTLSFWEQFAISVFAGVLRQIVKNPAKYSEIKGYMLEIATDIQAAFSGPGA